MRKNVLLSIAFLAMAAIAEPSFALRPVNPATLQPVLNQAKAAMKANDLDRAASILSHYQEQGNELDAEGNTLLASIYEKQTFYEEAVAQLEKLDLSAMSDTEKGKHYIKILGVLSKIRPSDAESARELSTKLRDVCQKTIACGGEAMIIAETRLGEMQLNADIEAGVKMLRETATKRFGQIGKTINDVKTNSVKDELLGNIFKAMGDAYAFNYDDKNANSMYSLSARCGNAEAIQQCQDKTIDYTTPNSPVIVY